MRRLSFIYAFLLILMGSMQAKAETLTANFNSGLPEGWSTVGSITNNSDRARSGNGLWTSAKSTTANYVITEAVQGTFEFYARAYNKNYASTVVVYEYTGSGLGSQLYTTGSMYTSSTPAWNKYSFEIPNGTQLAIALNYAAIDDVTYTQYEAPTGAALDVIVDGTKVDYNYNIDFGVTTAGATKTFTMKNPGGEDFDVTLAADGGFTLDKATATIAAKGEEVVTVTMPASSADGTITITPSEESGLEQFLLHVSGQIVPVMEVYAGETAVAAGYNDKFGNVTANTTHTYTVKNTGTAALSVAIASDNEMFTVSPASLEVAAGEEGTFDVTFNYAADKIGVNIANIKLTPADTYNTALSFTATASIADPDMWTEYFEGESLPEGWEIEGDNSKGYWTFDGDKAVAKHAINYAHEDVYLITPALEVQAGQELTFSYKRNFAKLTIQMQKDGGDWENLYADEGFKTDAIAQIYTISGLEASVYKFRFLNDDITLDDFEGFKLGQFSHDMVITSFDIPANGATEEEYVATVTLQEKAGVDEPMWAELYIDGNKVATANKEVKANTEETLTLSYIPTEGVSYKKAYIMVYNTNKDFTKKTEEKTVTITKVNVLNLDESTVNTITAGDYDRVKIKYTVREGWNTIALPFMVTDLTAFGESVKAWEFSGYTDGNLKFSKVSSGKLSSATPYILYVENPVSGEVVFKGVTINSFATDEADCYVKKDDATFQGTYSNMVAGEMEGKYGVTPEGKIQVGGANATMKAFRAYFELPADATGAKLVFDEDGVATSIDAAELQNELDGDIYDLSGRKVSRAQKGIYIKNGIKFVVK